MDLSSVIHEPKSALSYMFDAKTLHLRIKTKKNDVKSVTLLAADPFNWRPAVDNPEIYEFALETMARIPMIKEAETRYHDCWFAELTGSSWRRVKYGFVLDDGNRQIFAGCHDFIELPEEWTPPADHSNYYNYPYLLEDDLYKAPAWVKDTIWYQIFPDRFSRGAGRAAEDALPWGSVERDGNDIKFGGNIQGIIDKLDYIRDLGCGGIYFTPLFASPSSHKYDTRDYFSIDPDFGDNALFGNLVDEAHKRGIKVMLDAVFNHCGYEHPFWQDVLNRGQESPYYDYFYILDPNKPVQPDLSSRGYLGEHLNYLTFAYTENMPKWNTGNPGAREYLLSVAEFWAKHYKIDGWRLDVSNEVSHDFWREFRKRIKGVDPEIYILGENWLNSNPWLLGDQFDAVMNYEFSSPVIRFFGTQHKNQEQYSASDFTNAVNELLVSYPKNVTTTLFNLLDSHDTARILSLCGENADLVKLAYVFLLTYPGSPSIYYGGEVGLSGDEHHNRQCMPWEPKLQNKDLYQVVHKLIALRKQYPAFRTADWHWLAADDSTGTLIYRKRAEGDTLYVLIHNSPEAQEVPPPAECRGQGFIDLMTGQLVEGKAAVQLPPYSFLLWHSQETK